jgi:hypothetical protein
VHELLHFGANAASAIPLTNLSQALAPKVTRRQNIRPLGGRRVA